MGATSARMGGVLLLLREVDTRFDLCRRFAQCFTDYRNRGLIEHTVLEFVRERVLGLALGYKELHEQTGHSARLFTQFHHRTRKSWSRSRRVIGKAEYLAKGPNPRFIVTNLPEEYAEPQELYEKVYCRRGEMENRIKEQQLDLFADRTSTRVLRANQLRLCFSSLAYVLVSTLRRVGLKGTRMAKATCGSIRVRLFKIGALVKVSVRRFMVHLASACPYHDVFRQAWQNLQAYPLRL